MNGVEGSSSSSSSLLQTNKVHIQYKTLNKKTDLIKINKYN